MLGYTLIACLGLLAGIEALHITGYHMIIFYDLPENSDPSEFWSTTGGSNRGQRIFVIYKEENPAINANFDEYRVYAFSKKGLLVKECSEYLFSKHNFTNLIGLEEVSNVGSGIGKLVLVSSPVKYDHSKKSAIVTIDTKQCLAHNVLSTRGLINVVRTSDDKNVFDVVVKKDGDPHTTCGTDDDCAIFTYDLETNTQGEINPFVVNLNWEGMSFERLNDEELLVYGIDNHEFKWLRFDRSTGKSREMLSLLGFSDGKGKILHSGLTFCWINNQGVDRTVDCSRLDADDQLAAAKTVFFKKSVNLLFVHETTRNEILIVTSTLKENPEKNSTWSYNATKIRKDGSFTQPMDLPFPCVKLPTFSNVKYDAYENEVSFQYVCKQTAGFYHNEISIAMDDY